MYGIQLECSFSFVEFSNASCFRSGLSVVPRRRFGHWIDRWSTSKETAEQDRTPVPILLDLSPLPAMRAGARRPETNCRWAASGKTKLARNMKLSAFERLASSPIIHPVRLINIALYDTLESYFAPGLEVSSRTSGSRAERVWAYSG